MKHVLALVTNDVEETLGSHTRQLRFPSVAPAPTHAPLMVQVSGVTLHALGLAASQRWQELAGLSAPKPKQLAPIVQPSQLHEFVSGSQLRLVPQLRLPAATHWPPWH